MIQRLSLNEAPKYIVDIVSYLKDRNTAMVFKIPIEDISDGGYRILDSHRRHTQLDLAARGHYDSKEGKDFFIATNIQFLTHLFFHFFIDYKDTHPQRPIEYDEILVGPHGLLYRSNQERLLDASLLKVVNDAKVAIMQSNSGIKPWDFLSMTGSLAKGNMAA